MINIFLGLLKPTDGNILVDGKTINSETLSSYRSMIGYVGQNIFLIDESIAKNVAFGQNDKNIDYDKLKVSLIAANLWKFVQSKKME